MYSEEEHKKVKAEILASPITSIKWVDDCMVPFREVSVKYSGPDITKVIGEIPRVAAKALQVSGTHVYLDEYYWDHTDPNNIVFHIIFHADKGMDHRSKIWLEVKVKDGLLKPDGSGKLELEFSGWLETEFEKRTLFQRSPFYDMLMKAYTYLWYDDVRRNFLAMCNDYLEVLMRELRAVFNLMERGVHYGR